MYSGPGAEDKLQLAKLFLISSITISRRCRCRCRKPAASAEPDVVAVVGVDPQAAGHCCLRLAVTVSTKHKGQEKTQTGQGSMYKGTRIEKIRRNRK